MLQKNLKSFTKLARSQLRSQLSTQSQPKPQALPVNVSTLPSGILLASIESDSPLLRLAVIVRAGSRYEPQSKLGISHVMRSAAGLATERFSSFGITRKIEYHGGKLTVTGTRDSIAYLLEVHNEPEIVEQSFELMADTITRPAFKPWEVSDNNERLQADCSILEDVPFIKLTETLHQVAFKGGLRNSLYSPSFMIGKHRSEDLHKFHREHFVGMNVCAVGIGCDHHQLTEMISGNIVLPSSVGPKDSSVFIGGEMHIDSSSPLNYIAVGFEGAR